MTPKEFKTIRKNLNLTMLGLKSALSIGQNKGPSIRTIIRLEKGECPISGPMALAMKYLIHR
tara:strand:+ start:868 stop:1053 length:186 start_codon:yes stop_codon:yes gene_type:complete